MKPKSPFPILAALALTLPLPVATAQLDLPDAPPEKANGGGVELDRRPRGDVAPRPGRPGEGAPDLGPGSGATPDAIPGVTPEASPAGADPVAPPTDPAAAAPSGAADAIFAHLAGLDDPAEELVADAARSLRSMGPEGYAAARAGLEREEPAVLLASLRTLLEGGAEADRFLVLRRVEAKLPRKAAADAVDLLADQPPAVGLPALVSLCDHRQGQVRRRAADRLRAMDRDLPIPDLVELADASRSDTRRLAYGLLDDQVDRGRPEALEYLLLGLADDSARVAAEAAGLLAARVAVPTEPLVTDLLELARLRSFEDRRGGFAVLALVDAEDRLGAALLPQAEITTLLVQLRNGSPFVSAASAIALAGLGFRADGPSPWLDTEVTRALVEAVAGDLYYPEVAVVRAPALRRLGQLSGMTYGDDGPRWRTWWAGNRTDFQALRAVLPLAADDHAGLEVRWFDPVGGTSFRLLGSLAPAGAEPYAGRTLRLVPDQSRALYDVLAGAELFGAARLPGLLGLPSGVEPRLELRHGRQAKTFRFGAGAVAPWRTGVVAALLDLEQDAAWQLYPGPEYGLSEAGREAFFRAESPWWAAPRTPAEEAARLAGLVLDHMAQLAPELRDTPLERLLDLDAEHGVVGPEHFDALARLLADEAFLGRRGRTLLDLCLAAGADPALGGGLSVDRAGALIDLLYVSGDALRLEPMTLVYERAPRPLLLEAALDPRPGIRAVAAAVLARELPAPDDEAMALLGALLADEALEVEAAAVLSVSAARLTAFREEVFLRARVGDPLVRVAALQGVSRLGGEGALDVLREAALESEPMVRSAAAEALADLADPRSATLLTQMFAAGERGPFYTSARRGLLAIGEPAWDGLLTMARSRTSPAREVAALLLAEQGVPEVASVLMTMLTNDPSNADVAAELAMLTGRDFRDQPDPAGAWWAWSDGIGASGDALDWFAAALNAEMDAGLAPDLVEGGVYLDPAALRAGTREGAAGLVRLLRVGAEAHREERALRELERILDRDLGAVPPRGALRVTWCDVLLDRLPEFLAAEEPAGDLPAPLVAPGAGDGR